MPDPVLIPPVPRSERKETFKDRRRRDAIPESMRRVSERDDDDTELDVRPPFHDEHDEAHYVPLASPSNEIRFVRREVLRRPQTYLAAVTRFLSYDSVGMVP